MTGSLQNAPTDAWTGRLVGGRWRIVSLLDDSGGMASVYLAEDERLPRKAVVKIPKAAQFNAEFAERFTREAFWHAKVENLHVVHILDRGEEEGTPFLVLQYLPGGNLKAWCERNPSILDDPRLHFEAWLLPIAQALDAVAGQGIVHRDVKPSNILFDAGGQAYLSDFGIVKAGDATMTGTGMFIGTLQFMSPEQCDGEAKTSLDGRSDQYGLAVTVYQVLTGWRYPVDDTTVGPIFKAKLGLAPLTAPQSRDPRIPEAVNDAVMRALATDREGRFSSSVAFARAVLAGFGHSEEWRLGRSGLVAAVAVRPHGANPPTERPIQAAVDTAPQPDFPGSAGQAVGPRKARPWMSAAVIGGAMLLAVVASGAFLSRLGSGRRNDGAASPSPRVTGTRISQSGPFKAGDDMEIVVTFSRPVRVTGMPRIDFLVGNDPSIHEATFVRGEGTDRLTFLFEVPEGSIDGTGIRFLDPQGLDPMWLGITDASTGRAVDVTLALPASSRDVRIDAVRPRISRLQMPKGGRTYDAGASLEFVVEFTEPVEVAGRPELAFELGRSDRRAAFTGRRGATALSFAYRVTVGDATDDGVVATGIATDGATIRDLAGNAYDDVFEKVRSAAFEVTAEPLTPDKSSRRREPGTTETNSLGMKLVFVPAGEFLMGSEDTQEQLEKAIRAAGIEWPPNPQVADERPVHPVRITKPFLMAAHEVTLGQFMTFYRNNYEGSLDCEREGNGGRGYDPTNAESVFVTDARYRPWNWGHPNQTDDHPVVNVSWQDADAFCKWLSRREGKTYRLPTEAEWEYACRAGRRGWYWNGNDPEKLAEIANVGDRTAKDVFKHWAYNIAGRDGFALTAPVGSYKANPFGLYDMHGNVAEWCYDWHDDHFYSASPVDDPTGPDQGTFRVRRGGGWDYDPVDCRCASRIDGGSPSGLNMATGFRVVCELN